MKYNSMFTEYDSLPEYDTLTAREQAFSDCYEQRAELLEVLQNFLENLLSDVQNVVKKG